MTSFGELSVRYAPDVFRFALYLSGDWHEAEDITSETFVRHVTKDVVLDLLPLYLAGEASADTRALIEEYLKSDPDLTQRIRVSSGSVWACGRP